jgi:hypothetical protein
MFLFFVFCKNDFIKSCSYLDDHRNTKFYSPTLSGASLHSPQKFEHPPFWNGCCYSIKNYGVDVIFNGMTSLLDFTKNYQFVQKSMGGADKTHRMVISLAYIFPLGREVG